MLPAHAAAVMKDGPAFQLYAKDFYTGTADLTNEELGLYMRALVWSWDNGPLPLELARVQRIVLASDEEFARCWLTIERLFERKTRGFVNVRLEQTRREQRQFKAAKSHAGVVSGIKRRHLTSEQNANRTSTDHTTSVQGSVHGSVRTNTRTNTPTKTNSSPASSSPIFREDQKDLSEDTQLLKSSDQRETPVPAVWKPTAARVPNLINGARLRRHGSHAWCAPRDGLCVPHILHEELLGKSGKAESELRAWYAETVAQFDGQAIGDDVFAFYRNCFARWVGLKTSMPAQKRETVGDRITATFAEVDRRLAAKAAQS